MKEYSPDFEHLPPVSVVHLPARDVPDGLMEAYLGVHTEQVKAQLMDANPLANARELESLESRAATIVGKSRRLQTMDEIRHPNKHGGEGGTRENQLYFGPHMTFVFDTGTDTLRAVVGSVLNTSPSGLLPGRIGQRIEEGSKLLVPWLRYVKVTRLCFYPDEPAAAVIGLYRVFLGRPAVDGVSAYHIRDNPADAEMGWAVKAMGLEPGPPEDTTGIPGYPDAVPVVQYKGRVGKARAALRKIPGAKDAIERTEVLYSIPEEWHT